MQFTPDQIVRLAPDDASVKAGKALAVNSKWQVRCVHEKALWGDCQGSGKTPYRTIVDISNLAFKCSCPSRKFPCKHGLGLLFLYADNPSVFSVETELAQHVQEWLEKRSAKEESKNTAAAEKGVDVQAQQKRAESRERKVTAGIEELQLWLKDVVRTGMMNVPQNPYQFNQSIIARMVDSQAGGLANQLRKINQINFYKEGWQKALLKQLSKVYLLTEAYANIQALPEGLQADLRTLIGWNIPKEEVLSKTGLRDSWLVMAITNEEESNLRTERVWLYGLKSGRYALILNFYAGAQVSTHAFIEGGVVEAELVYYPSETPLRALFKDPFQVKNTFIIPSIFASISDLLNTVTERLSTNPFTEQIPYIFSSVRIYFEKDAWFLIDDSRKKLPLINNENECWTALSISRAEAFGCFGIYENESFNLLALWQEGKYFSIN